MEARLLNERKDLEKMIAEVEQHAAKLKEETASVEEISRSRTQDELMIEERREQLQGRERELADFETDLKMKAKSLEEHGQTISKLETQVKERLQRAVDFETKSEELEQGLSISINRPYCVNTVIRFVLKEKCLSFPVRHSPLFNFYCAVVRPHLSPYKHCCTQTFRILDRVGKVGHRKRGTKQS